MASPGKKAARSGGQLGSSPVEARFLRTTRRRALPLAALGAAITLAGLGVGFAPWGGPLRGLFHFGGWGTGLFCVIAGFTSALIGVLLLAGAGVVALRSARPARG